MSVALNTDKKKMFQWGITAVLAIAGYFLPLGDIYTTPMKRFVAITIIGLCLLAFNLMNNWAIGMMMPALWVLFGVTNFSTAFSAWVSPNSIMLINALIFAGILSRTGLMQRIGYGLILKSGGTYKSGVWAILLVGIVISAVSMMTNFILIATLALAMYKALDLKPTDKEAIPLFTAVILAATHAKAVIYCPLSIGIMNASIQSIYPDMNITYGQLLLYNFPILIFIFGFMWLTLKWYERSTRNDAKVMDLSEAKAIYRKNYEKLGKMSRNEKIGAVLLASLFIWMLLYPIHKLDIAFAFIICNVLFFVLGIAEDTDVKNANFSMFAVVMAFVAVGTVANALQLTGLISSGIASIFGGLGHYWATLGTLLFGVGANFILTPYAMMSMLPATVASYCAQIDWSFWPHFNACYLSADIVFFPYEYPLVLILYGFGMCSMNNTIKMLTVKGLLCIAFIALIMMPYWYLIGLYA